MNGKKENFNEFRFKELNYRIKSNKYLTMNRVSQDKIVVKTADTHLVPTKFGYALILTNKKVVFLKDWQVDTNYYGTEVLLTREFFNVKEWGDHENFGESGETTFDAWKKIAQLQQDAGTEVNWSK